MNLLEQLAQQVSERLPDTRMSLDRPKNPQAAWWLDLSSGGNSVTVEWRPEVGFGVNAGPAEYGEKSDEFYADLNEAAKRVTALLLSGKLTVPSKKVFMKRIRELCGLTQVELARRLNSNHSQVSKLESDQDICLSTLSRYVACAGGKLRIQVEVADQVLTLEGSIFEEALTGT